MSAVSRRGFIAGLLALPAVLRGVLTHRPSVLAPPRVAEVSMAEYSQLQELGLTQVYRDTLKVEPAVWRVWLGHKEGS